MTIEEVDRLEGEISTELARLGDDTDSLSRKDRKHHVVLRARKEALEKIREAIVAGDFSRETRAALDYGLLTEYGERNFFLFNWVKSQVGWRLWW